MTGPGPLVERPLQSSRCSRRDFVKSAVFSTAGAGGLAAASQDSTAGEQRIPLKIGLRAASMKMVGTLEVFKLARQIPGLLGVELQVTAGRLNLRDWNAVRRYKTEANRWGMQVPSISGVWDQGVSIMRSPVAGINLLQSIRAAELLGSSIILVPFFRENAPDMNDASSYGPVVKLLKDAAPDAAEAGVIMGLENSLNPADNQKLIDLVDHPNVRVYYDVHNMAHYGYADQAVTGIKLLGRERICQVHVKNQDKLIAAPGLIDWRAAFQAFNEIGYDGWYVFETQHASRTALVEDTVRNIEFLQQVCRMPVEGGKE